MQEDFFTDTILIGISCSIPVYRFCWMLNRNFDLSFCREHDLDIRIAAPEGHTLFFPVYQYSVPLNGNRHLLYKLKTASVTLLPEIKQLDFLWLIQGISADKDAATMIALLKEISGVQLVRQLYVGQLKHPEYLLL